MYNAWIVFFLMWLAFAWTWKTTPGISASISTRAPIFRQNCTSKDIPCADDCSFLCVENGAKCIDGICRLREEMVVVPCNEKTGGVSMIARGAWSCICTNATFYGGSDCSTLNEDVCENGMFLYKNKFNFLCLCLSPYQLVTIDNKPHCVEKAMLNFVKEGDLLA